MDPKKYKKLVNNVKLAQFCIASASLKMGGETISLVKLKLF